MDIKSVKCKIIKIVEGSDLYLLRNLKYVNMVDNVTSLRLVIIFKVHKQETIGLK